MVTASQPTGFRPSLPLRQIRLLRRLCPRLASLRFFPRGNWEKG